MLQLPGNVKISMEGLLDFGSIFPMAVHSSVCSALLVLEVVCANAVSWQVNRQVAMEFADCTVLLLISRCNWNFPLVR